MALSGAKFQEASLGQYGSTYLAGDGDLIDFNENNNPSAKRYVCSITFLEDTQFEHLESLGGEVGSFSDLAAENNLDADVGVGASGNGTTLTVGASGQVFPKGITVFGRWDFVELHSGACICYFAPV